LDSDYDLNSGSRGAPGDETIRITEQQNQSIVTAYLPGHNPTQKDTKQTITFGANNTHQTRIHLAQARTETHSMNSSNLGMISPNVVAVINEDHKGRSPSRETMKSHQKQRRG
jgi:hypothetical protein